MMSTPFHGNQLVGHCNGRVLVVDDDPDIRELMIGQLEREGLCCHSGGSVGEAQGALAEQPAEVVVLDLNLPDGDGLALCRDLRARGYADAIIMVTARDSALDRVLGLELGADDYLTKPFEPRSALARAGNLIRRWRPRRQRQWRGVSFARATPVSPSWARGSWTCCCAVW
jgi:two-component system OmpR family response regulator